MKYRLFPTIFLIYASGITLFLLSQLTNLTIIPIQMVLMFIIAMITIWALSIHVNSDAIRKELIDLLDKRLPDPEGKI